MKFIEKAINLIVEQSYLSLIEVIICYYKNPSDNISELISKMQKDLPNNRVVCYI
jgi:hypothetical protein